MKVLISAREVVHYSRVVEMTPEQFKEIQDAIERDEGDAYFNDLAEQYLDRANHVEDGSGFEDVEFYEEKPKQP